LNVYCCILDETITGFFLSEIHFLSREESGQILEASNLDSSVPDCSSRDDGSVVDRNHAVRGPAGRAQLLDPVAVLLSSRQGKTRNRRLMSEIVRQETEFKTV
jgi:hypothetical protein